MYVLYVHAFKCEIKFINIYDMCWIIKYEFNLIYINAIHF